MTKTELSLSEIFKSISKEIHSLIDCDWCMIARINQKKKKFHYYFSNAPFESTDTDSELIEFLTHEIYEKKQYRINHNLERSTEKWAPARMKHGHRSSISAPILLDGNCIAHLSVVSKKIDAYDHKDAEILCSFTENLANTIHNANLYQEAQTRTSQISALNEINLKLASKIELPDVLDAIVRHAATLTSAEQSQIFIFDEDSDSYRLAASFGHIPGSEKITFPAGIGLIGNVAKSAKGTVIPDVWKEPRWLRHEWAKEHDLHSFVAQPIFLFDKVHAVIDCFSREKDYFEEFDLEILTNFSLQAAVAIQNAELRKASTTLTSELNSHQLLDRIADESTTLLKADRCLILTRDSKDEDLKVYYQKGISKKHTARLISNLDNSLAGKVMSEGILLTCADIMNDSRYSSAQRKLAKSEGFRALLAWPLKKENKPFGALILYWDSPHPFSDSDLALAQSFNGHAAIAIENAHLHTKLTEQNQRLEIINKISAATNSSLIPSKIFQSVFERIRTLIPLDRLIIAGFNPSSRSFSFHFENDRFLWNLSTLGNPKTDEMLTSLYKTQQPVYVSDMADSEWKDTRVGQLGYRSVAVIPIVQDGETTAHLNLASRSPSAFTEEQINFIHEISSHFVPALSNMVHYYQTKDHGTRLSIQNEIIEKINKEIEPSTLFLSIAKSIREHIECDRCVVSSIYDGDWKIWATDSDVHFPPAEETMLSTSPWHQTVYEKKRPVYLKDIQHEKSSNLSKQLSEAGFRSVLIYPILLKNKCIAHLSLCSLRPDAFEERTKKILESLCPHLATAIQNAKLHEETLKRVKDLESLQRAARVVTSQSDLPLLLEQIATEGGTLLEADRCLISSASPDGDSVEFLYSHGISQTHQNQIKKEYNTSLVKKAIAESKPIPISDILDTSECDFSKDTFIVPERENFRSLLLCPLLEGDKAFGVLTFYWDEQHNISKNEIKMAAAFTDQAAIAILNARHLEEAISNRNFYQSIVGDSQDSILVLNPDRKIIGWNKGAEILYGYSEKEAIGESIDILIPAGSNVKNFRKSVFEDGNPVHHEVLRQKKGGTEVWVDISISPVRNELGEIIAATAVHKDMTKWHTAEKEVRDREARLHSVLDTAADAIITISENGAIFEFNKAAENIFGYLKDEVIGKNISRLMPPTDGEAHNDYIQNYLKTGISKIIGKGRETIALRKDGTLFPVHLSLSHFQIDGENIFTGIVRDITVQKNATRKIEENEKWFRSLFEQLTDPLYVHDAKGNIFNANKAACRALGYTHRELLSMNISDFSEGFSPENFPLYILQAEEITTRDVTHRRKDGSLFPCEIQSGIFKRDNDTFIISIARDLTSQKKSEKDHELYTSKLELLDSLSRKMTSSLNLDETLDFITQSAAHFLKAPYARLFVLRDGIFEPRNTFARGLKTPPPEQSFRPGEGLIGAVGETGTIRYVKDVTKDKDFTARDWAAHNRLTSYLAVPLKHKNITIGVLAYLSWGIRTYDEEEISLIETFAQNAAVAIENAKLHSQAQESLSFFQSVAQDNRVAIVMTNTDLEILHWNKSSELLFGYPAEEVIGKSIVGLTLTEEEYDKWMRGEREYGKILREPKEAVQFKENRRRKDGTLFPARVTLSPIIGENNELMGVTAFFEDLTEQKITEEKLRQKEKNDAIALLASGVAHDFNNMLAIVISQLNLLKKKGIAPDIQNRLNVIEKAAWSGAATVDRLLKYSRQDAKKPDSHLKLHALIKDTIDITQPIWKDEAQKRGIFTDVRIGNIAERSAIRGDEGEITEVFVNIINNAIDAMPDGGILEISTKNESGKVKVSFSDTGTGMKPEVRARILEPFFTTKAARGTGLGLSVVASIMEHHGGSVEIESEVGVGTTVNLLFHLDDGATKENATRKEVTAEIYQGYGKKILILEDEKALAMGLAESLEEMGYVVDVYLKPMKGIQAFRESSFDLVLTDLGMPGMSGWEVAAAVKKENPRIPVALITGWGTDLDPEKLKESGIERVLTKPFQMSEVLSAIDAMLES